MLRRGLFVLGVLALPALASAQQTVNLVNLWLVNLQWDDGRLVVGTPVKLTHDDSNNNQPWHLGAHPAT
ncbi:MAG: hypothetical protein ABIZ91_18285 [Gemmatimonadaceae bacterium]